MCTHVHAQIIHVHNIGCMHNVYANLYWRTQKTSTQIFNSSSPECQPKLFAVFSKFAILDIWSLSSQHLDTVCTDFGNILYIYNIYLLVFILGNYFYTSKLYPVFIAFQWFSSVFFSSVIYLACACIDYLHLWYSYSFVIYAY